ncbi:UDP-glucose 4-epimerase GalE [Brooklawnia cerclae]|uniref:UDP-glucose 4-epimerase n=1 Tax=Brooklawnia cerclae TaxID=349934 RepID=A0ABX0SJC0_9ACTN|nr:UDP-glucose 4-epimerase [Brooklawnia cerclae]
MRVLITGGAGYIGSTVASACLDAGHEVVVIDDLSAGRAEFVRDRVFYRGDIGDEELLDRVLGEQAIDAVVHCAARIVVPDSVAHPLEYYGNNVGKTLTLLGALDRHHVTRLLFSSSASIYGPDDDFQVDEDSPVQPGSPYARTKLMTEMILADVAAACDLRVISLRYFNPIGTDPRLRTGQQIERPTHVLGRLIEAWQTGSTFTVTGMDWPTRDGSGIRDFIHVWDLARAHVAALERFDAVTSVTPHQAINIGTGRGVTVRELLAAFEEATGEPLRTVDGPPRPGDVCGVYTRSAKAERLLGWTAALSEADAIRDALAWLPRRKELLGY